MARPAPRERFTFVWHNGQALCASGELTERPNVTVLKTVESSRAPWVQIPHSPRTPRQFLELPGFSVWGRRCGRFRRRETPVSRILRLSRKETPGSRDLRFSHHCYREFLLLKRGWVADRGAAMGSSRAVFRTSIGQGRQARGAGPVFPVSDGRETAKEQ